MRKLILIALAVLASASFNNVDAAKKKTNDKKAPAMKMAVKLANSSDSLSYAAGVVVTNGLLPYLQRQFGVDTTYMADFIEGFNEALDKKLHLSLISLIMLLLRIIFRLFFFRLRWVRNSWFQDLLPLTQWLTPCSIAALPTS